MVLCEFSLVKVGDQFLEKIYLLICQDLVNYVGVLGDLNLIYWDDEIVKVVGLDIVIVYGMLMMGIGGGYVIFWVGDLGVVIEYNVWFIVVVLVFNDGKGVELVFNGWVKLVDFESKLVIIVFIVIIGGKKIFGWVIVLVKLVQFMVFKIDICGMIWWYLDYFIVGCE